MPLQPFKDHFSKQSDLYLKFRPQYPPELYSYLASLTQEHELAWDCGTGNGQAAIDLAAYYRKVMATDPSEQQIKNALTHERVSYSVSPAERCPLASGTADLITAANALHWFDFDSFNAEALRVMKPGAVFAAWGYGNPSHSPGVDEVITYLHDTIIGSYWLPENRLVEKGYSTVPFPFTEITSPGFKIEKQLSFDELVGLFGTWSAVQRYKDKNGKDPVALILPELEKVWLDKAQTKPFTWRLILRAGRK